MSGEIFRYIEQQAKRKIEEKKQIVRSGKMAEHIGEPTEKKVSNLSEEQKKIKAMTGWDDPTVQDFNEKGQIVLDPFANREPKFNK